MLEGVALSGGTAQRGSDFFGGFFDGRYEFELAGWAFDFSTGDLGVCLDFFMTVGAVEFGDARRGMMNAARLNGGDKHFAANSTAGLQRPVVFSALHLLPAFGTMEMDRLHAHSVG